MSDTLYQKRREAWQTVAYAVEHHWMPEPDTLTLAIYGSVVSVALLYDHARGRQDPVSDAAQAASLLDVTDRRSQPGIDSWDTIRDGVYWAVTAYTPVPAPEHDAIVPASRRRTRTPAGAR